MQMKLACVLLAGALVASARVAEKPKTKTASAVIKPDAAGDEVAALTKKVEHVVTGLEGIYAAQGKSSSGPTKFAQILKPFLSEMHKVLTEVKTDAKLTDGQKIEKLHNAQASVKGLTKDMNKLTQDLHAEGEEQEDSLLLGVLMARKNRPEAEQLEVMKSGEFKDLEVVRYVLAHRDSKKNLVEQVAAYLDQKPGAKGTQAPDASAKKSLQELTQGIVGQLEGQLTKMEQHLATQEALHKNISAELSKGLKTEEAKVSHLKGTDQEKKRKAVRAKALTNRMIKKEDREYAKQHAMASHDIATLKKAIESVKKGDMKALSSAQEALAHSLSRMQASTGDFLHFLQVSEYIDSEKDGACPYCKAQCLEKCHSSGHSFMECMNSCADVGN